MRQNGGKLTLSYLTILLTFPSRRSQRERVTPAGVLASCLVGTTLIGSLLIMGLSASIVAHDHNSSIGISHLVVVSGMSLQFWSINIRLTNENLISL